MVKIVLVDDHDVVREGLRSFLELVPEFSVVGQASSGLEVEALVEQFQPDLLIVDLGMPGMGGLELTLKATRAWPNVRVIILSMRADDSSVQQALANGAVGYVLKNATSEELIRAVHDVMAGRRYLSSLLVERAIDAFMRSSSDSPSGKAATLTPREQEVLRLAAEGYNNAQVANQLSISPRTAETHRANLMRKLGLRTQTDLVRYAIRNGLLPTDEPDQIG